MIKKNIKAVFFLTALLCSIDSAFSQINYSKRINEVVGRAVDMTYIFAPMGFKEFEVIYERPEMYLDSAIQYLGRSSYEQLQFSVVSLSMCELKPEKYLTFLESCFESYYDKKIGDSTMILVLGGVFGNPYIRDNYADERVQNLLKRLIENKNTSAYIKKDAIKYRDGKVSKSYEGPNPMIKSEKRKLKT